MGTKYLRPISPIVLKIFQIESSENSVPPNTAKLPTIPPIKITGSIYETPVLK